MSKETGQVKLVQVKSSQDWSCPVKTFEVKLDQVKLIQVKFRQVKSSYDRVSKVGIG